MSLRQPAEKLTRSVSCVRGETLRLQSETLLCALEKALKPGRLRLPQRLKSNLEIVWHIALPGSPAFQTPFQHAAVLHSDSNYHARLSTAD
jgi:hypothetical protein